MKSITREIGTFINEENIRVRPLILMSGEQYLFHASSIINYKEAETILASSELHTKP